MAVAVVLLRSSFGMDETVVLLSRDEESKAVAREVDNIYLFYLVV